MIPKIMKQGRWAPWLYILPALMIMTVFIVYPTIGTFRLSLMDDTGTHSAANTCVAGQACWGVFENYHFALTNPDMLLALRNNALWLLLMVPGTIVGGLFFALLADRVRYESIAKAIIFMPTAISFIGAGVIWRFVYDIETGGGAPDRRFECNHRWVGRSTGHLVERPDHQ